MPPSFRILALSALLTGGVAMLSGAARAAEIVDEPLPVAKSETRSKHADRWRGKYHRYHGWHAPSELIAGVRGATPLTVPFFGFGWYPGPAYYYGPRPVVHYRGSVDPAIAVKY
jgi:hypothetical protein